MKHLRYLLIPLLLLLFMGQKGQAACMVDQGGDAACSAFEGKRMPTSAPTTFLSNATGGFRLTTTRPQRVTTTHAAQRHRTIGKTGGAGQNRPAASEYSRFKTFGGWLCRMELPLRPFVSRFYYIIALRRIIR